MENNKFPSKEAKNTDNDFTKRLTDLDAKLAAKKEQKEAERSRYQINDTKGFAYGLRMGSEFLSAVLIGAGIGCGIDYYLGTLPIAMIIMLLFGFVAGMLNVYRSSLQIKSQMDE